jgi:predicted amidohydrolase YtcJ
MARTMSRRRFLRDLSVVTAGAVLSACAPPVATPSPRPTALKANLVLRNGRVLTMDPAMPEAEAVAIDGEAIAAVGSSTDILALAPDATVMDLGGRMLLQGFNDAHCHRIGDRDLAGYDSAETAIQDALAGGWTSISEMFVNQERVDELTGLDEAGKLPLRVNAYLPVNYLDQKFGFWFNHYRPHQVLSPRVRIAGAKAFADQAWTRQMYMTEAHLDKPGYHGDVFWTPEELTEQVRFLHDDGWQVAIHTAGDAAHDMVLDAYETALAGADNRDRRHRIEHCMALRDDQIERMRDLAILASFQLTWFSTDANMVAETTLDPERLRWLGRWRDLLEAGVPAVASTDHPWDDLDSVKLPRGGAMHAMAVAVTRVLDPSVAPNDWQAAQRLTVDQLLPLMTSAGAYATFEEDRKGTVTPGKLADIVVLDDDPRVVPAENIRDVKVVMTMIGGQAEYCAPGAESLCPGVA